MSASTIRVLIDDLDTYIKKLEEMGAPCFMRPDPSMGGVFFETKFSRPRRVGSTARSILGSRRAENKAEVDVKETRAGKVKSGRRNHKQGR